MSKTMKAAVFTDLNKMSVQQVAMPVCGEGEILMRVKACAVCGSDIRIFHSGNSRVKPPQTLGHEFAGEIVETGKGVTKFKKGDRVALGADVPCGECYFCKAGIGNNCQINYAMGYQFAGGFAEYVLLNKTVVNYGPISKLPDNVSYTEGALAEPLACVLNALSLTPVKLNDVVVLIGAGPIGLMICEVAKIMGASKIILINRSTPRLETAKKLKLADVYVCSKDEDAVERVMKETGSLGADVIFTANPSPDSQADSVKMAKNRAHINFFGGLPKGTLVTLDTNIIHYKEIFVTGAHGSMPPQHEMAVSLIASGRIDIKKFITHEFSLDNVLEAFKTAEEHAGLRVVVKP